MRPIETQRLRWTVAGETFRLDMVVSSDLQARAMEQLHAGLVMTGQDAVLEVQRETWEKVET